LLVLAGSAALVALAAYLVWRAQPDWRLAFAFALVSTLLAGYHVNANDLALMFPSLLVAGTWANEDGERASIAVIALLWFSPLYLLLMEKILLTVFVWPMIGLFLVLARQLRRSSAKPAHSTAAMA
jgi:hypothetical protein